MLTLKAAAAVPAVTAAHAPLLAPPVEAALLPALDDRLESLLTALLSARVGTPAFLRPAAGVTTIGDADLRYAARSSASLLDQAEPGRARQPGSEPPTTPDPALLRLRHVLIELAPRQAAGPRKFLGVIPFGDKLVDYFRSYRAAQSRLNAILQDLRGEQSQLAQANAALNRHQQGLWSVMRRLNTSIRFTQQLHARLSAKVAELERADPDRATLLGRDVVPSVRDRHRYLLSQLTVCVMSYLTIGATIENNLERIRGLDQAYAATVALLRSAMTLAPALTGQRLVLDEITAVDSTTTDPDRRPADLSQLSAAFADSHEALDVIDTFERAAAEAMASTLETLRGLVDQAESVRQCGCDE